MRKIGLIGLAIFGSWFLGGVLLPNLNTPGSAFAGSGLAIDQRVLEYRLKNRMKVLMVTRPQVPIVSLNITYRVGSVDETSGMTGVAHLFEHMAFKGTQRLGTKDYDKEKPLLDELEAIDEAIRREEESDAGADPELLGKYRRRFEELQAQAQSYVINNEIGELYNRHGGVGFNAGTGSDYTRYTVSLPANRLPLWAAMEADRMANTVMREFYKERDVVLEERRLRVDNQPSGKLREAFLAAAFQAHPYGNPTIGWESDIASLMVQQTRDFFQAHYTPENAVLVAVGDLDPEAFIGLVEDAFGTIPKRSAPISNITREPKQAGERRLEVQFDANPRVLIGYHTPGIRHEDAHVLDVIDALLSQGRTSRLYSRLVKERQVAVSVFTRLGTPGAKYPGLFVISAVPRLPHTTQELEEGIYEELERLKNEPIEPRELQRILNQLDASLIRSLSTNSGLAAQLAYFEAVAGTWRYLLDIREKVSKVTPEDIMRAARKYFNKNNRTVATLVSAKAEVRE